MVSRFRDSSAAGAQEIQQQFEREEPAEFIIERLTKRWLLSASSRMSDAASRRAPRGIERAWFTAI
jgi:hypothetical protein